MRTTDFKDNRIDYWSTQNCEMRAIEILASKYVQFFGAQS